MSRLGKLAVELPSGVKAVVEAGTIKVEGPKGKLSLNVPQGIDVRIDGSQIRAERKQDDADHRARHGLARQLIANMVTGVSAGYEKRLDIVGVGYRAAVKGNTLALTLGFSHPVDFDLPVGVSAKVEANTKLTLSSADKALLGNVSAKIRALRPPEPYQGKGIKYADEVIRRKAGKSAAGGK